MAQKQTVLQVLNNALLSINETTILAFSNPLTSQQQQLLSSLNQARAFINNRGSFPWDEYWGTFITPAATAASVGSKQSYVLTPDNYNYIGYSRGTPWYSNTSFTNLTVNPMYASSFDDTFMLNQLIATDSIGVAYQTGQVVGTSGAPSPSYSRMTGSVWLMQDQTHTPTQVVLSLTDQVGGHAVTVNIPNTGTLDRFSVSGYFGAGTTAVELSVGIYGEGSIVYVDGYMIENSDYATEYFDNETGVPLLRSVFADPLRLLKIAPYKYNAPLMWNEILYPDSAMYPNDHIASPTTIYRFYSTRGNTLNLENVPTQSHLCYRAKRKPPIWTSADADTLVDIPPPEVWVLIAGVVAFEKEAIYDIGSSTPAGPAWQKFIAMVTDLEQTCVESPAWGWADICVSTMMR